MDIDKPNESVLPSNFDPAAEQSLKEHSDLLKNLVAIGSHILVMQAEGENQTEEQRNQRIVIASLFRRFIAFLDACATLVATGSLLSCGVITRAAIELANELNFLLLYQGEIDFKTRCYLMMDIESELQTLERIRHHPNFKKHEELIKRRISQLETAQQLPYFKPIQEIHHALVFKKGSRTPKPTKWYTLATSNKPGVKRLDNVFELTDHLTQKNCPINADVFSLMSNFVHSSGIIPESIFRDGDQDFINTIRNPDDHKEFVDGLIGLTRPVLSLLISRQNRMHREECQSAMDEFKERYNKLYNSQKI